MKIPKTKGALMSIGLGLTLTFTMLNTLTVQAHENSNSPTIQSNSSVLLISGMGYWIDFLGSYVSQLLSSSSGGPCPDCDSSDTKTPAPNPGPRVPTQPPPGPQE